MNDMVEKVARAIVGFMALEDPSTTSWDNAPVHAREGLMRLARVAIKAMREPTEAMLKAPEMSTWAWVNDERVDSEEIADAWRSMIDEALK